MNIIQWKKSKNEIGLNYVSTCYRYTLQERNRKYELLFEGRYIVHAGMIVDICNNLSEAKYFADYHYMNNTDSASCYID